MSKLFIHNYPWLAGNQDLLASLETAILAHGAEVLADCIKLHAFLVGEGGEASYGDCDSTFRILSEEQLKEINSGYCHPKITHGMWHQNHCGDWSHLFCWSDDKEVVERKVQKALLTSPEQTSFHQYLIGSRRAVFHISMWNSVGEEGDDLSLWRRILKLVHSDYHKANVAEADEVTKLVLKLKPEGR